MKIKMLFLAMAIAFFAFFLTAMPLGCTEKNKVENTPEPANVMVQTVQDTSATIEESVPATVAKEELTATRDAKPTRTTPEAAPVTPAPKPAAESKSVSSPPKTQAAPKASATEKPAETTEPKTIEKVITTTPQTTTKTESNPPVPEAKVVEESPIVKVEKNVETEPTETEKPVPPAPPATKPAAPKTPPQVSEWPVPESAKKRPNPVKADNASIKSGKTLWGKHCASCHGKSGLGDGSKAAQLDTPSGDFTLPSFQAQTDGALFYKTVEGRDDMPGYKKKIPDEEDIWHLVNFMRTLK